jgi:hypothetical protein
MSCTKWLTESSTLNTLRSTRSEPIKRTFFTRPSRTLAAPLEEQETQFERSIIPVQNNLAHFVEFVLDRVCFHRLVVCPIPTFCSLA